MAEYDKLRNDDTVKQWLATIKRKPNTEKSYLMGLQKYLDFTGMRPDELLTEAEDEDANKVPMRRRKTLRKILEYRDSLEANTDYAATSKRNYLNAVMSFYRASYIDIPKLQGGTHAEAKEENTQAITKDDIRDILKVCDPLERALVLVGASSGLSEGYYGSQGVGLQTRSRRDYNAKH